MKIFGAGLAGLLAACHFQTAEIYEAKSKQESHKALLRFRTKAVGDAVGIDFKKVRVHKAIWYDGKFHQPNPMLANMYSKKVIGNLSDRSIWDIAPCDRYIAPEDFIDQLIERCAPRIHWDHPIISQDLIAKSPVISTLPLSTMHDWVGTGEVNFSCKSIVVRRYRITNADVYQTIYFPDPEMSLYRASITGGVLILESMHKAEDGIFPNAFGISQLDCIAIGCDIQSFGKINTIDDQWRKGFIYDLTTKYNIYSLGRYATWRNILLDDVLNDIAVVKKLMKINSYDRSLTL